VKGVGERRRHDGNNSSTRRREGGLREKEETDMAVRDRERKMMRMGRDER